MSSKRKRRIAFILIVFFGHVAGFGGWWMWRNHVSMPRAFAAVKPGILYRSGQPGDAQLRNAIEQEKIKTIICLRDVEAEENTDWYDKEKAVTDELGVTLALWPMASNVPLDRAHLIRFLRMTQYPSQTPILIHCAQGRHRTGFFAAVYRMVIDDWTLDHALNEMSSFGFNLDTHSGLVNALKELDVGGIRAKLKEKTKDAD